MTVLWALEHCRMSNFDEKSGLVYCKTPWGQWAQTIEEVFVEVNVPEGTRSRDVKCDIKAQSIRLLVHDKELIKVLIAMSEMIHNLWLCFSTNFMYNNYILRWFCFRVVNPNLQLSFYQKELELYYALVWSSATM